MSWILSIILRNQIRGKQISGKALDGSSTDSLWVGTLHREGRGEPTLYLVNFNKKWGREKLFQVILVEQEEEEETKEEKIQAGKADSHFKHPILIVTESTDRPLLKHPEVIVSHFPGGHLPPPKFGHLPPPKTVHLPGGQLPPPFFSSFFGAFFLAFSTYSSWRTSRMGRRRCLMRWSWSTSSRRWLSWWSWRTSRRRKGRLSFMFLFMAAWITHF